MRCLEALCCGVDTSPPTGGGLLVLGVCGVQGDGGGMGVLGSCGVQEPRGVPLSTTPPAEMTRHTETKQWHFWAV